MSKQERQAALNELESIVKKMDVPVHKQRNVAWLGRHLEIRNSKHPAFDRASDLIKRLLSHGIAKG